MPTRMRPTTPSMEDPDTIPSSIPPRENGSTSESENSDTLSSPSPKQMILDLPLSRVTGIELWKAAMEEEIGVRFAIPKEKQETIKNYLYKYREELPAEYKELMICTPGGRDELYIVKKSTEIEW
jgi:hypothetical protein